MTGKRVWKRALALLAGGCLASMALADVHVTSAGASLAASPIVANPFSPATGHAYRHGVVPTISQLAKMKEWGAEHLGIGGLPVNFGSQTLAYGGGIDGIGVTSGTPKVYLVFWGSQWGTGGTDASGNLTFGNDPSAGAPYIQNTFKGLGTGGELWSGVMTQYCDGPGVASGATSCPSGALHVGYPTGGALAGAWYDGTAATPAAATSAQLAAEAVKAAAHFGNQTQAANRYAQYVILSPHGANPDTYQSNGFCAWHDYTTSSYGDIAYTNMPYVMDVGSSCGQAFVNSPGTLDGYSMVSGHEYSETVTDQNPAGGWTNQQLLSTYGGEENADECAWISSGQGASANVSMATGTFAMQSTWSNDTNRCDISHQIVTG